MLCVVHKNFQRPPLRPFDESGLHATDYEKFKFKGKNTFPTFPHIVTLAQYPVVYLLLTPTPEVIFPFPALHAREILGNEGIFVLQLFTT